MLLNLKLIKCLNKLRDSNFYLAFRAKKEQLLIVFVNKQNHFSSSYGSIVQVIINNNVKNTKYDTFFSIFCISTHKIDRQKNNIDFNLRIKYSSCSGIKYF